jgi:N6-L-threonylcarbamoyladenine synthase
MIQNTKYKILSIDTSCDETSTAVIQGVKVLSNVIWSQASLHAKWGGVVPSLAKRKHQERIDWVVNKALGTRYKALVGINAVAVTVGPGLAIALEVGIKKAKEISKKFDVPFIPVNHIEGHLLSPLAQSKKYDTEDTRYEIQFPALGLVTSGGHTEVVLINKIGDYKIIAQTHDDALGEALDKGARLLGFGYPGGEILENIAKEGSPTKYDLPIPMLGREKEMYFSYSGLKTAFVRLIKEKKARKKLTKNDISNLAASYQHVAFTHFIRVLDHILKSGKYPVKQILAGGGVMANVTLRKMVRKVAREYNIKVLFPYSKKLYGDNAAMIGVAASFKYDRKEYLKPKDLDSVDRIPRVKVDRRFSFK